MAQAPYRCSSCGAVLGPGMSFCPTCGIKFSQPTPSVQPAPYQPPPQQYYVPQQGPTLGGSVQQGLGWGCGCLVALAVAIILFILYVGVMAH